jgi:hypothetical protein
MNALVQYLTVNSFRLVTLYSFAVSAWMYFLGDNKMLLPAVFWFVLFAANRIVELSEKRN